MTIYVCKTCGRAMKSEERPTYCYADRMDHLENISDDDHSKMFLFSYCHDQVVDGVVIEFPGDYRFNPMSGEEVLPFEDVDPNGKPWTLQEYQNHLVAKGIYV